MLVHPDPVSTEDPLTLDGIVRDINERITVHDVRTICSPTPGKVIFDCVLPPDIPLSKPEIIEAVTRRLQEKFPECETVIMFDEGYAGIPKSSAEK